jgi:hypothetical protein
MEEEGLEQVGLAQERNQILSQNQREVNEQLATQKDVLWG